MPSSKYEECITDVLKQFDHGILLKHIAAGCSVNVDTVRRWLMKAGKLANRRTMTTEERSHAVEMYVEGYPMKEIASKFGVTTSSIIRLAHQFGVARTNSEAQAVRASRGDVGDANRGKKAAFQSIKAGGWVAADSAYEYARMAQLEDDQEVYRWERCSFRIPYVIDGVERLYVPDLLVSRSGGVYVEEIKPNKFIGHPVNQAKFQAAEEWCWKNGYTFSVITEEVIGRKNIERFDGVAVGFTPEEVRKTKRIEATQRCYAKKSQEEKSEILRKAREREAAKREANREEYNRYARERRAAKRQLAAQHAQN